MRYLYLILIFFIGTVAFAQSDSNKTIEYKKYYYENGNISSEGYLVNGEPNRYWKTYFEDGTLKSEGNRKNFELDSTWKFYTENGDLKLLVNYKNGIKNGVRITYLDDRTIEENFENDIKNGETRIYYENDSIWKIIPYEDGLQNGVAKEFDRDGRLITLTHFKNGFIRKTEYINRRDFNGNKTGVWKYFYENGNLKRVENYRAGIKNGYFEYYDEEGNLVNLEKYSNGEIVEDPPELAELEIKKEYYPDGSIKAMGSYKDGVAEGVTRYFDENGEVEKAFIFKDGRIIGRGIVDKNGEKQGDWKEYYLFGGLKSEGKYENDKKVGYWKYYHINGNVEQEGKYAQNGKSTGEWKWYFSDGSIRKIEFFVNGVLENEYIEYSQNGEIKLKGEYIDGVREGPWKINVHGYREEGEYLEGFKSGLWKYYYSNNQLYFKGSFLDGIADGNHIWYYPDGTIKQQGSYVVGMRDGVWYYYNEQGQLILKVKYKNGIEMEYDAVRIEPELEPDNY